MYLTSFPLHPKDNQESTVILPIALYMFTVNPEYFVCQNFRTLGDQNIVWMLYLYGR